jgi:hypothetical protein
MADGNQRNRKHRSKDDKDDGNPRNRMRRSHRNGELARNRMRRSHRNGELARNLSLSTVFDGIRRIF